MELVQDHEALQASGPLLANLKRIQILNSLLQDQISSMSIDRGTLKAFKHQVMQGASERQDLAAIVERLAKAKQDLGLHIQLVHVGLTMDANRAIGVNLRLVEEMNEVVRTVLGKEKGLMIASFVDEKVRGGKPLEGIYASNLAYLKRSQCKSRATIPDLTSWLGDGRMQLTTSEYRALLMMNHLGNARAESVSSENTKASAPRRKERYVNDNLAVESTQINVPIEVDVWAHMDYVNVQGNVATRNSLQVNYPMTLDVYREVRGGGSQKSSRKYSKK